MRVRLDPEILDLLKARLVQAHRLYPPHTFQQFSWQGISVNEHVSHAAAHINDWIRQENPDDIPWDEDDHLVHAFTRLYLALAVQEIRRENKRDMEAFRARLRDETASWSGPFGSGEDRQGVEGVEPERAGASPGNDATPAQ